MLLQIILNVSNSKAVLKKPPFVLSLITKAPLEGYQAQGLELPSDLQTGVLTQAPPALPAPPASLPSCAASFFSPFWRSPLFALNQGKIPYLSFPLSGFLPLSNAQTSFWPGCLGGQICAHSIGDTWSQLRFCGVWFSSFSVFPHLKNARMPVLVNCIYFIFLYSWVMWWLLLP